MSLVWCPAGAVQLNRNSSNVDLSELDSLLVKPVSSAASQASQLWIFSPALQLQPL